MVNVCVCGGGDDEFTNELNFKIIYFQMVRPTYLLSLKVRDEKKQTLLKTFRPIYVQNVRRATTDKK